MYLIGIDISKYKHDCFIATETGEVVHNSFSFENNYSGFNSFLKILNSLDKSQIRIGLEATGHYGNNLKTFLFDNGFNFMEINPIKAKSFVNFIPTVKPKRIKLMPNLFPTCLIQWNTKPIPLNHTTFYL